MVGSCPLILWGLAYLYRLAICLSNLAPSIVLSPFFVVIIPFVVSYITLFARRHVGLLTLPCPFPFGLVHAATAAFLFVWLF